MTPREGVSARLGENARQLVETSSLHSSTFRLSVSTIWGIRHMLLVVSLTEMAQVELRSGRM
jgi:hypothetical protein